MNNKPIVVTWGLGSSYRDRIKQNFVQSISSGYDNTMDYIILTDVPSDFDELRNNTNKIIDVVNIHEARKDFQWSIDTEHIPTDQEDYGKQYRDNLYKRKFFTYSLNRFSLPRISELGYTKFIMHDPDSNLKYNKIVSGEISEEEFWDQFNTPTNSMKGCHKEELKIEANTFYHTAAMGHASSAGLQLSSIILDRLNYKYNTPNINPIVTNLPITEGPFRYYHFESPEKVKQYFDVWNECCKIAYGNNIFIGCSECGGYMLCDYIPVGAANKYLDIKVLDFSKRYYDINIYFTDRFFMPKAINLPDGRGLIPANTIEDFYRINEKNIEILKSTNQWPMF
jgi:hypothetical protein